MRRAPVTPLVGVAVFYAVVQMIILPRLPAFGWDEVVYVSQVSPHVPAAELTAPRARGVSWLAAPAALLTTGVLKIRIWMVLLSAAGLVLAYLPWLRILNRWVVAFAAFLLTTLWVVLFNGPEVMPNLYVAYGAVATTGCFVLALRHPTWPPLIGLGGGLAAVALLRPGDAAWLALPLGLWALAGRHWRVAAALAGAGIAGVIPWVIEAYTSYGGLGARLDTAAADQGGLGPAPGFLYELRAASGPALCRPCEAQPLPPWFEVAWLLILPVAVAAALAVTRNRALVAAAVAGLGTAAQYLFFVNYAAPRFMIATYALWMLPVAAGMIRLPWRKPYWIVIPILAAHAIVQFTVLDREVQYAETASRGTLRAATALREMGVHPPCVVTGGGAGLSIAYATGCEHTTVLSVPEWRRLAADKSRNVAYISRGDGQQEEPIEGWVNRNVSVAGLPRWVLWAAPQ